MFYSHSLLARKSPMGTVWMAAHLEQRIKKPQIDVIDIPSYAECIMFPEVPIALRLSGHLLLGLVRIYSLKVKYLFQDCNRMLSDVRTVFASVQINLPVDADRAPFESVTLPNTFELDSVELGDYRTNEPDNHLRTFDQITLQDQFPFDQQYVSIYINEDDQIEVSPRHENVNPAAVPMEEDILPPFDGGLLTPIENFGHNDHLMEEDNLFPLEDNRTTPMEHTENQTDSSAYNLNQFSNEPPEIMRDAEPNPGPELADTFNDFDRLHEQSVPSINKNGNLSPISEHPSVSGEGSFPLSGNKVPTVASADVLGIFDTSGMYSGEHLPDITIKPSPPGKKRKRRQYFDESLVLTNAVMKEQLNNTSKLVCKRRKLPCSALDIFRYRRIQNELLFHEPLLSGMCSKIKEVYERRISPRSYSVSIDASSSGHVDAPETDPVVPDTNIEAELPHDASHVDAPQTNPIVPDRDTEPELPRDASHVDAPEMDHVVPDTDVEPELPRDASHVPLIHDLMQNSPVTVFTPSAANTGSVSDKGKTLESEVLPTYESPTSTEPAATELPTPVNLEEQLNLDDSSFRGFSSIADVEELNFLEESNASSGSDATEVGNMSERTRKVAQYLIEYTPQIHTPEDQSGCLSLNKILEGKTRKQSARMFFETLVLKSYGLVDVQQKEDYGDILISRTPGLSSFKF